MQDRPRRLDLRRQRPVPVVVGDRADLAQRRTRGADGAGEAGRVQVRGGPAQRDQDLGEAAAQGGAQAAGDPQPFPGDFQFGRLGAGALEVLGQLRQPCHSEEGEPHGAGREEHPPRLLPGQAEHRLDQGLTQRHASCKDPGRSAGEDQQHRGRGQGGVRTPRGTEHEGETVGDHDLDQDGAQACPSGQAAQHDRELQTACQGERDRSQHQLTGMRPRGDRSTRRQGEDQLQGLVGAPQTDGNEEQRRETPRWHEVAGHADPPSENRPKLALCRSHKPHAQSAPLAMRARVKRVLSEASWTLRGAR
ncbi:hypothetical protein GCM10010486_88740 [Nonomuraea roseoviolacea subsp. carminata]